jgi:hypothetical protein
MATTPQVLSPLSSLSLTTKALWPVPPNPCILLNHSPSSWNFWGLKPNSSAIMPRLLAWNAGLARLWSGQMCDTEMDRNKLPVNVEWMFISESWASKSYLLWFLSFNFTSFLVRGPSQ